MKGMKLAIRAVGVVAVCGGMAYAAPPSPCSLLTVQEVTAALGVPVGDGQAMGSSMCVWTQGGAATGAKKVYVTLMTAQGFQMRITPVNDPAITKKDVSGIGDQANYGVAANQPGSLAVKKGGTYFSVQVRNVAAGEVQAKETTLAKDILAKL